MIIVTVIAIIVAFISIIMLLIYRRQIKSICRQLAFIHKHNSNMIVTQDISFSETTEMINQINNILEIQKSQKIEYQRKDTLLKEIITNLSHDIRTPLTSLDGYFQLLVEADVKVDREHYTGIIKSRIKSLKQMLDELFTYTKLQNDSYQLDLSSQNINQLFCDSIISFYRDFKERKIEPDILITEEQLYINYNEEAMKRVLQNIIKNGLEHSKDQIEFSIQRVDDKVVMKFRNRYHNVEELDVNRIFERFYKADKARSQTSTGLGLAIAKGLVEKMNGNIRAELVEDMFQIIVTFSAVVH